MTIRLSPILGLVLALGVPALAAEGDASPGRSAYLQYCGACHGPNGAGDGIAGSMMQPKPSDLTKIAEKNGGTFPFVKTMGYIDGTENVRAHGDPAMPVWGEVFKDRATLDNSRRIEVRGKLMVITDYLQSIQKK